MIDKNTYPPGTAIDEALWTAYRRDDKAAVMDYLFRRNRVGIGCSRSLPQLVIKDSAKRGRAAKRGTQRTDADQRRCAPNSVGFTLN
jgi:hypothetical protein